MWFGCMKVATFTLRQATLFFFACAEKCIFEQTGTRADGVVGIWEICMNIALYQRSAVFVFALCP